MDPKEKRRRQIRAAMVLKGITGAEIARDLGVTKECVNQVIAGKFRSRRVEEALMAAGVPGKWFAGRQEEKEQENHRLEACATKDKE